MTTDLPAEPIRLVRLPLAEVAARVFRQLAALGARPPSDGLPFEFSSFQAEAIDLAWRMMLDRGGVVLADPVGMGKTYVAVGLIDARLAAGDRSVLVTVPAAIAPQWARLLRPVAELHGIAFSGPISRNAAPGRPGPGRVIERAEPISTQGARAGGEQPGDRPAGLVLVTHTGLALGHCPKWADRPDLVVADEAHAFRNPRTRRYQALARQCARGRVLLLTATPINNSLLDLYFLIRLFLPDDALADLGVASLHAAFDEVATCPDRPIPAFDRAVAAVLIRRTRDQFRTAGTVGGPQFPIRAPPVAIRWALPAARELVGLLGKLDFVAYTVGGRARRGSAPDRIARAELLRYVLLKRLESGLPTFALSLRRLEDYLREFRSALEDGLYLPPATHRRAHDPAGTQLVITALVATALPRGVDRVRLADGTAADMERLARLREIVERQVRQGDPKADTLMGLLAGEVCGRKVIVFTEFRDTAAHLYRRLAAHHRAALIQGDQACVASGALPRREVVNRFAPRANGGGQPGPRERIDLLIATDVLSEGLNLQDAEAVVSYDLPWNPVRLVQRLGRIDRLNSPHTRVFSYNFLPDRDLDAMLGLVSRIERKVFAARIGLRSAQAAHAGPTRPRGPRLTEVVERIRARDATLFADLGQGGPSPDPLDDRFHAVLQRMTPSAGAQAEACATAAGEADAAVPVADHGGLMQGAWGIVALHGTRSIWLVVDSAGTVRSDRRTVLETLLDGFDDRLEPMSLGPGHAEPAGQGREHTDSARAALAAVLRYFASGQDGGSRAVSRREGATPETRIATALLASLAAIPGGPDPDLATRADTVLSRLRRRYRAAIVDALVAAATRASSSSLPAGPDPPTPGQAEHAVPGGLAMGTDRATERAGRMLDRLEAVLVEADLGGAEGAGGRGGRAGLQPQLRMTGLATGEGTGRGPRTRILAIVPLRLPVSRPG